MRIGQLRVNHAANGRGLFVTTTLATLTIREAMCDLTLTIGVLLIVLAIIIFWAAMVMWSQNLLK